MAKQATRLTACGNCAAPVRGSYCHVCGQKHDDLKRSLLAFVHEFIDGFFNYDARVWRTLFHLVFKPGALTRAFTEGKRARFVPPVRLYVIITLVLFVTLSLSDVALVGFTFDAKDTDVDGLAFFQVVKARDDSRTVISADMLDEAAKDATGAGEGLTRSILDGINEISRDPRKVNQLVNVWLPRMMILLLPLFAATLKLFYIFRRRYLLDHAIYSLHFHSAVFLLLTVLVAAQWVAGGRLAGPVLAWTFLAGTAVYSLAALKGFYRQGWIMTTFKWAMLGGAYIIALATSLGLSIWFNTGIFGV